MRAVSWRSARSVWEGVKVNSVAWLGGLISISLYSVCGQLSWSLRSVLSAAHHWWYQIKKWKKCCRHLCSFFLYVCVRNIVLQCKVLWELHWTWCWLQLPLGWLACFLQADKDAARSHKSCVMHVFWRKDLLYPLQNRNVYLNSNTIFAPTTVVKQSYYAVCTQKVQSGEKASQV